MQEDETESFDLGMKVINNYIRDSRTILKMKETFLKINNRNLIKIKEEFSNQMKDIDNLSVIYKTRYQYVDKMINILLNRF